MSVEPADLHTPKTMSPRMMRGCMRGFALPFLTAGVITLLISSGDVLRARASTDWPTAPGTIERSVVDRSVSSGGDVSYHADVRYTYRVDRVAYTSSRVLFGDIRLGSPERARRFAERYPPRGWVDVAYDPAEPAISVLEPGVQASAYFAPAFGLFFVVIGLGLALFIPRWTGPFMAEEVEPTPPDVS